MKHRFPQTWLGGVIKPIQVESPFFQVPKDFIDEGIPVLELFDLQIKDKTKILKQFQVNFFKKIRYKSTYNSFLEIQNFMSKKSTSKYLL